MPPEADASLVIDDLAEKFFDKDIKTIDIKLSAQNLSILNNDPIREEYVEGDIDIDDESYTNVGVRYKGGFTLAGCLDPNGLVSPRCSGLSFKIKFNKFSPDQRFHGLKRINLHAMSQDTSNLREAIFYKVFRDHGIPGPRTTYVRLSVNGESQGIYLAIEAVDGRFTKSRFENDVDGGDGNLYKSIWPNSSNSGWYSQWLRTNKDDPKEFRVTRFVDDLNSGDRSSFRDLMETWTNVNHWLTYIAIIRLIEQWDSILTFRCWNESNCNSNNFFIYEGDNSDKLTIIPWDFDNTMVSYGSNLESRVAHWTTANPDCSLVPFTGQNFSLRSAACDPFISSIVSEYWNEYVQISNDIMENGLSESAFSERVEEAAAVIDADMQKTTRYTSWLGTKSELKSLAKQKRNKIKAEIE